MVQLSDRGDCLFRAETHRRSCDWSNFLTRKGVFQMSLQVNHPARRRSNSHKGSSRPRKRTRWSNFDRGDCLFCTDIHRRSCDWSNFLTREGVFQMSLQVNNLARRKERKQRCRSKGHKGSSHTLVQISDRGNCLFRAEIYRRSCGWSNFLTRKGVFQISLAGVALSKGRPQRIFQATEAHTLVQLSDRGDCLFRAEIHRRSCDWSNFLTRKGVF